MEKTQTCRNCPHLEVVNSKQKEKIQVLERRMRDLIKAYKAVVVERDNLFTSNQLKSSANLNFESEKRLSALEENVAQLSDVCGKYEQQRVNDEMTIADLTAKCESLENQLAEERKNKDVVVEIKSFVSKEKRNRYTQTDVTALREQQTVNSDNPLEESLNACIQRSVHTQTEKCIHDFSQETDSSNVLKAKRSECAVVVPTQRESVSRPDETALDNPIDPLTPSPLQSNEAEPVVPNRVDSVGDHHTSNPPTIFSLFYANEIARKDIELKEMKLRCREMECVLRELQLKYNIDVFKLQSELKEFEKQRRQLLKDVNFHPNLTYVRNVLLRFIDTKDKQQKQCMINALLTALDTQISDRRNES